MSGHRHRAATLAKKLEEAREVPRIAAALTEEELDWMLLLSERMWAIYDNRAPEVPR